MLFKFLSERLRPLLKLLPSSPSLIFRPLWISCISCCVELNWLPEALNKLCFFISGDFRPLFTNDCWLWLIEAASFSFCRVDGETGRLKVDSPDEI